MTDYETKLLGAVRQLRPRSREALMANAMALVVGQETALEDLGVDPAVFAQEDSGTVRART